MDGARSVIGVEVWKDRSRSFDSAEVRFAQDDRDLRSRSFDSAEVRFAQDDNSKFVTARSYSGLGMPVALSCLANRTRALSSLCCTLATSPGSMSAAADLA